MGRGPDHLVEHGLVTTLRERGHAVQVDRVEVGTARPPAEIRTSFELNRLLAERVADAARAGALSLVLAGNCSTAAGTCAGLGVLEAGVVWFDAHGDFNTPETTVTGFLDGMALALLTGRCWSHVAASIPGFRPVPEEHVVLVGARDFDPPEEAALASSAIRRVHPQAIKSHGVADALRPVLTALQARVRRLYVHLDLDVLDPNEARANEFAAPNGLTLAELDTALRLIGAHVPIAAAALTAYDPSHDADGRARRAAAQLIDTLVECAAPPPPAPSRGTHRT